MTDTNNARITRIELEKLLNFVKLEMESKKLNVTGLLLSKLRVLLQITFLTESGGKNNVQEKSSTIITDPGEIFIILIILGIWIYSIGRYGKPILISNI